MYFDLRKYIKMHMIHKKDAHDRIPKKDTHAQYTRKVHTIPKKDAHAQYTRKMHMAHKKEALDPKANFE